MPGFLQKIWHSFIDKLSALLRFVYFSFIPRRRNYRYLLVALVLIFVFFAGVCAFAADPPAAPPAAPAPATSSSAPAAPNTGGGGLLDDVIMLLNSVLFAICRMLGWVALKIFAMIVLISSYNDFITSAAVTKGWALLRDVCNLFLVLILLVVAFAMILRVKEYGSTQMLFFVIRAAILINFSKLICGLIIDFAQVVMMTFVNGYAATAGANLIEGLGLANLMSFGDAGTGGGIGAFDIFLTLWIAIFMLLMTIIVTFFILLLLLLRIVQLWILVVTSPLAFMGKAVPVKKLQSYCGKWWDTFTGTVMVGPLMAFFLWLSLLVMSNPSELMITDTEKLEAQSKGSNVTMGNLGLQPMIQGAIGLCMLMAGLMAAKEAGGAVGSMGGDFSKYATSAAKSIGGKMSGYSQVKDRSVAAYKGWEGRAKERKQMTLAKYTRAGESVFATKESAVGLGKKVANVIPSVGINAGRALKNFATGKPLDFGANMKRSWQRTGQINDVVKDSIEQDHEAKRRAEAEKSLDARGIKKPDDLRSTMMDGMESKDIRKAAALKLKGQYKSADEAKMAKSFVAGDRKSATEFDDAMDKEQAHLVYDMKDPEQVKKFTDKLKKGKITLGSQKEDFFASPEHLKAAEAALGGDKFNAQMQGVVKKGSIVHQDAIKKTLQETNTAIDADERAVAVPGFDDKTAEGIKITKRLEANKKIAKPMRSAMATVTSDLSQVFATTDAGGKPDLMHDELKTHLKYASGKDLAKKDIREKDPKNAQLSDKVVEDLAAVVSKKQLKDMAVSKTEGAATKVEIIVKQMIQNYETEKGKKAPDVKVVAEYESRLSQLRVDNAISDCINDDAVKTKLAGINVTSVAQAQPAQPAAAKPAQASSTTGAAMASTPGELDAQGEAMEAFINRTEVAGNPATTKRQKGTGKQKEKANARAKDKRKKLG